MIKLILKLNFIKEIIPIIKVGEHCKFLNAKGKYSWNFEISSF